MYIAGKHKIDGLKDLWSVVDKKTDKQLKEQTEEDAETNKYGISC